MRDRVLRSPTPSEWAAVASILVVLVASSSYPGHGIDWEIFAGAADGRFVSDRDLGYYYAYWLLPLFDLYAVPGVAVGGIAWAMSNVCGAWFAARVFGARPVVVLCGFGALSAFYTGTITGLAVGAVAGFWWAVTAGRWGLAGWLTLVAVAKPQWGLPLLAAILASARPRPRDWAALAVVPAVVGGASLVVYGWWPGQVLSRLDSLPPVGNGSLWHFVGPISALLWLPVFLPMAARTRLAAVAAASMLAVPYVQQYDHLVVWVLVAEGLGLLAYLAVPLDSLFGEEGARAAMVCLPLAAYLGVVAAPVRAAVESTARWLRRSFPGERRAT